MAKKTGSKKAAEKSRVNLHAGHIIVTGVITLAVTLGLGFLPWVASAHGVGPTLNFAAAPVSATSVQLSWTSTSATSPSLTQHDLRIWACHGVGCTPTTLIFSQISNFLPVYTGTYLHTGLITGDTYRYKIQEKHGGDVVEQTSANIVVVAPNTAPDANDDTYSTNEDTAISVTAADGVLSNDTDNESDPLTASLVTTTSHGTLTFHANGSFEYTPDLNWSGTDTFTYKANDGHTDSPAATVSIVVSNTNDAPVGQDDVYTVAEDGILTVNAADGVLANDSDVDGNTLTAVLESDVNDGTLTLNSDGSFTYTPDTNWSGMESFTYKPYDGTVYGSARTAVINVSAVNDAPTALAGSLSTTQDVAVSGTLAGSDPEGDSLTFAITTNPSHGTLTAFDAATGAFTYTPASGYVGGDLFSFTVSDGSLTSAPADITITVNAAPVVTPPVVTPPSNGGGSSGGNGGGGGGGIVSGPLSIGYVNTNTGGGIVLGTSTEASDEILPPGCTAYLSSYLHIGRKNDAEQVKKLQSFLNKEIGANLPVTGFFGKATFEAVKTFQVTHWEKVLKPWVAYGLPTDHTPTGYVYKTTKHTINLLSCAQVNEPEPVLP